jgi:hypothetical protein
MSAMSEAHAIVREWFARPGVKAAYGTYAVAFADALRSVYRERHEREAFEAEHGVGMVPAFQIVEPSSWLGFSRK